MNVTKDSRAKPLNRTQLGLENQSFVFGLFGDGQKLTVNDVYEMAREAKTKAGERPLNERTIRRALDGLQKAGFIITVGRQNNAILYGKQGTSAFEQAEGAELIPLAGELVSVEKFMRMFADPSLEPFKVKRDTLAVDAEQHMRQMLLFAIISSGSVGLDDKLKQASKLLHSYLAEVEYIQKVLKTFIDSPVWYEQYRDRIAYEVRRVQEKDPALYQLAIDAIKGG
jgi:hypothetical protein